MMEEMQNRQTQPPVRRRRPENRRRTAPKVAFLPWLGKDVKWYYDVRLWSPLILLLLILALLPCRREHVVPTDPKQDIAAASTGETIPEPTEEEPVIPEAAALARLADSVGGGRSQNVKTIIMWVAINRSEDRLNGFGLSLLEEIERPNQWQDYNESLVYTKKSYEVAKEVLEIQRTEGLRPLDPGMLWFVLNDDGSITVRNQFSGKGANWIEKTVK